jgi:hypothetical protein
MLRTLAIGVAAVATFSGMTGASATTFNVTQAGVFNNGTVNIGGVINGYGVFAKNEITGPIVIKGTDSDGKPFELVTFCFDLLHNINVGIGGFAGVNYTYKMVALSNDLSNNAFGSSMGMGNPLTAAQIEKMTGLARLGAYIYNSGISDKTARLAGISSAIWSTEYGVTASGFVPANALGYYNDYLSRSFPGAKGKVLVSVDAAGTLVGNLQGLGVGTVPEPGTWAMMIIGFGLVGVGARRRAPKAIAA